MTAHTRDRRGDHPSVAGVGDSDGPGTGPGTPPVECSRASRSESRRSSAAPSESNRPSCVCVARRGRRGLPSDDPEGIKRKGCFNPSQSDPSQGSASSEVLWGSWSRTCSVTTGFAHWFCPLVLTTLVKNWSPAHLSFTARSCAGGRFGPKSSRAAAAAGGQAVRVRVEPQRAAADVKLTCSWRKAGVRPV